MNSEFKPNRIWKYPLFVMNHPESDPPLESSSSKESDEYEKT